MSVLIETLTAPGAPGLSGNLVDAEGYPRADINIHTIRTQRHRLACLRTDHKLATDQIEKLLHEALAPDPTCDEAAGATAARAAADSTSSPSIPAVTSAAADDSPAPASTSAAASSSTVTAPPPPPRPPFAIVDEVTVGSPAEKAGLLVGDAIVAFGAISLRSMATNESAMSALPGCLREHENRAVDLAVNRGESFVELKLTPSRWDGQGLLGCHVVVAPAAAQVDSHYSPQVAVAAASRSMGGAV